MKLFKDLPHLFSLKNSIHVNEGNSIACHMRKFIKKFGTQGELCNFKRSSMYEDKQINIRKMHESHFGSCINQCYQQLDMVKVRELNSAGQITHFR